MYESNATNCTRRNKKMNNENNNAISDIIIDSKMNCPNTCRYKAPLIFRIPTSRARLSERAMDKLV